MPTPRSQLAAPEVVAALQGHAPGLLGESSAGQHGDMGNIAVDVAGAGSSSAKAAAAFAPAASTPLSIRRQQFQQPADVGDVGSKAAGLPPPSPGRRARVASRPQTAEAPESPGRDGHPLGAVRTPPPSAPARPHAESSGRAREGAAGLAPSLYTPSPLKPLSTSNAVGGLGGTLASPSPLKTLGSIGSKGSLSRASSSDGSLHLHKSSALLAAVEGGREPHGLGQAAAAYTPMVREDESSKVVNILRLDAPTEVRAD